MTRESFSSDDLADLWNAKKLLENPSVAARIANAVGTPIEKGLKLLPQGAKDIISTATTKSLKTALSFAVSTMEDRKQGSSNWIHKSVVAMTGLVGGAFGLPALAVELPISTTIMLRSIADIARSEGEKINSPEAKLACLEVFALGGPARGDDGTESGYFAIRSALAKAMGAAVNHLAGGGLAAGARAPVLIRFIAQVAERFGIQVTEKAMAQAIPVVGAVGGALINTLFIDHFQDVARGHFIVRRLERKYGSESVKEMYQSV